jgi:hypothetical protein
MFWYSLSEIWSETRGLYFAGRTLEIGTLESFIIPPKTRCVCIGNNPDIDYKAGTGPCGRCIGMAAGPSQQRAATLFTATVPVARNDGRVPPCLDSIRIGGAGSME